MAINSYFFNAVENNGVYDRTYNADDFNNYLDKLVGNGVFPNPSTNLQVLASTEMGVTVGAGQGWINGYKMVNTAALPLTVAQSNVSYDRIDRVVFYVDFVNRLMNIAINQGTPSANPTAPALVRDSTRYEMSLATITVPKQATSISNSNITDTRGNSSVCGFVQGLIQQVSTDTLFTQWQTAFNNFYTQMTSQFETWFDNLTQQLNIDTYIEQYQKIVEIGADDSAIVSLDMAGYTYSSNDIFIVIINGLVATESYDYILDTRNTPVQVHLNVPNKNDELIDIRVLKSKIGINTN